LAARASLAAHKQGKFEEFHEEMMALDSPVTEGVLYKTADSLGMDLTKMQEAMYSSEVEEHIKISKTVAQSVEISGTPTFIVGNKILAGAHPIENLREAVEEARQEK
jgi:predicted DsbA family dithiol-disulfide isomerase